MKTKKIIEKYFPYLRDMGCPEPLMVEMLAVMAGVTRVRVRQIIKELSHDND